MFNHATVGTGQGASWTGVRKGQALGRGRFWAVTWEMIYMDSELLSDSTTLEKPNSKNKRVRKWRAIILK